MRVNNFEKRKVKCYSYKRIDAFLELFDRSLKIADYVSLIGNDYTLKTFPEHFRKKLKLVAVYASKLSYIKSEKDYFKNKGEYLWFYGGGAVHKGLDLVIDIFLKSPHLSLTVIGPVCSEKDSLKGYANDIPGKYQILGFY